jgi:hypothetical protein
MSTTQLPGLDRLLTVCQEQGIVLHHLPPGGMAPGAGGVFMGRPFDPLLAAAYARFGALMLSRSQSLLIRCDDEVNGLQAENEDSLKYWPTRFHALTVFGKEMRYCYATVPELADAAGLQPIVWIDPYEEIFALPVASSVDCFFLTYSRFLESMADDPDFKERHVPPLSFPWDVPELLAEDAPLAAMVREGRFDRWMYSAERDPAKEIHEWVAKLG